jgi:hypothetical protein
LVAIVVTSLQFTVSTPIASAAAVENVNGDDEPPTMRNGMHACPLGWFMSGAHIQNNDFLCSRAYGGYAGNQEFVDGNDEAPTQRNGMHACPLGTAMTGLRVDRNWLSCAPLRPGTKSGIFAYLLNGGRYGGPTQRSGMHACGFSPALDEVMVGIHVQTNVFLCTFYYPPD